MKYAVAINDEKFASKRLTINKKRFLSGINFLFLNTYYSLRLFVCSCTPLNFSFSSFLIYSERYVASYDTHPCNYYLVDIP